MSSGYILMVYSEDLRRRVLNFLHSGGSKINAAKRFTVSRAIIYVWLKAESLIPAKTGPKGHSKLNVSLLKTLIESKPDAYLDELAAELNVSDFTVAYGLKRLGISRKKNHAIPRTK
jgi:putative transposase